MCSDERRTVSEGRALSLKPSDEEEFRLKTSRKLHLNTYGLEDLCDLSIRIFQKQKSLLNSEVNQRNFSCKLTLKYVQTQFQTQSYKRLWRPTYGRFPRWLGYLWKFVWFDWLDSCPIKSGEYLQLDDTFHIQRILKIGLTLLMESWSLSCMGDWL